VPDANKQTILYNFIRITNDSYYNRGVAVALVSFIFFYALPSLKCAMKRRQKISTKLGDVKDDTKDD